MSRRNGKTISLPLLIIIVIIGLFGGGYAAVTTKDEAEPSPSQEVSADFTSEPEVDDGKKTSEMKVHFIDCGQADSILIQSKGHNMLVDAGNNADGDLVVDYLKQNGVKKLDYVIGTHPHEDHIGGLDNVINSFSISKVIMPPKESTTKTFEDVLDALKDHNLKITKPVIGKKFQLGDASFTILSPNADYGNELNNWSVGIRLVNGKDSFVLCGDSEAQAENDICDTGLTLKADVLKLNHHGSHSSSTERFLAACSPEIVVISCGKDNDYGHPHQETLDKINEHGYKVYRTDLDGTIVAKSSGHSITMQK